MQANAERVGGPAALSLKRSRLLQQIGEGSLSEDTVEAALQAAVSRLEAETALQALAEDSANTGGGKRVKLFLAVNPISVPDPASFTTSAKAPQQAVPVPSGASTGVIDLVDDDDAVLGRLVSQYASEYKRIVGKQGASLWLL